MGKNNIIERNQRCSIYTKIFFGYVKGRQYGTEYASISSIAKDFISEYDLEDILDANVIQVSYSNFTSLFKELTKDTKSQKY